MSVDILFHPTIHTKISFLYNYSTLQAIILYPCINLFNYNIVELFFKCSVCVIFLIALLALYTLIISRLNYISASALTPTIASFVIILFSSITLLTSKIILFYKF